MLKIINYLRRKTIYIYCKNKIISLYKFIDILNNIGLTTINPHIIYGHNNDLLLKMLNIRQLIVINYIVIYNHYSAYSLTLNINPKDNMDLYLTYNESVRFVLTKEQLINFLHQSLLDHLLDRLDVKNVLLKY